MGRKGHPLAARIKKIMQTDEDVGKISHATPIMIARALELFLQRVCKNSCEVATARKAKTLTCSHVKAYVNSDELMDFLQDTVASAPDLPPEGEPEQPKPKRQRTAEPKPRAPRGSKSKRDSADGVAAAAAAAGGGGGSDAGDPPAHTAAALADAEHGQAVPAAAAVQAVKQDRSSSSPTAAQAKAGFGGLGAHPFLAARTFGKPGAKKPGSGLSPKPESPHKQQQQQQQPAAAGAAAMLPAAQQQQQQQMLPPHAAVQQQQREEQEQSAYAQVAPSLLPGLSAQLLAGFAAAPQQTHAAEDDYDDDYDS